MPIIYTTAVFLFLIIYTILIFVIAEKIGFQIGKEKGIKEGKQLMLSSFQYGQNWKTTDNYQGQWK